MGMGVCVWVGKSGVQTDRQTDSRVGWEEKIVAGGGERGMQGREDGRRRGLPGSFPPGGCQGTQTTEEWTFSSCCCCSLLHTILVMLSSSSSLFHASLSPRIKMKVVSRQKRELTPYVVSKSTHTHTHTHTFVVGNYKRVY